MAQRRPATALVELSWGHRPAQGGAQSWALGMISAAHGCDMPCPGGERGQSWETPGERLLSRHYWKASWRQASCFGDTAICESSFQAALCAAAAAAHLKSCITGSLIMKVYFLESLSASGLGS